MPNGHCFLCHRWGFLEEHHIFGGSNHKHSTKYKLTVFLCGDCHRTGKKAAHGCKETMQKLHEYGQRKFMRENNATVADFRRIFGRNYLDDEE